jgi:ABC-type multidrug transport system fused ATPase/permease subunit
MNPENNLTIAETDFVPTQNIPEVLSQISAKYHEEVSKKNYKTPKFLSQPSIFKISKFSTALYYIDSSLVTTSSNVKSKKISDIVIQVVYGVLLVAGIAAMIAIPIVSGIPISTMFEEAFKDSRTIIQFVLLAVVIFGLIFFYIGFIITKHKAKKQRENINDNSIYNLVRKIKFSDENRVLLEDLMKTKLEL